MPRPYDFDYEDVRTLEAERVSNYRRTAMLDYILHICGMVFSLGTLSIVALVINYIQRPASRGTIYESHFTWMIRTCWWTLFWAALISLPVLVSFGIFSFLYFIPAIWYLYRMVKGLLRLSDRRPMPIYA
ncbi:MAG: hypothetical protein Q4B17_08320 [Lautropia sp.]|nr:hypothetical protein [Lautropia sp.]